ncbi:unnamed protein product [Tuber melanosporum]|uniref:(Perigord truffle) hypothetical protein n=1 Tax=Tuber melanosporum (strain Mel28) TaxID=656061 RepID=D5GK90_TUBMM|nr:uncharacterized protein GSTUM_00009428001 [Tuber melanosporum]CAZ84933.1 unnamed protein product [Tuber melanosporum]
MQSILYGGVKDQELTEWYFNTSLLFVGSDHLYWDGNKSRRKKYGNCKLTGGDVISTVMLNSQKEAASFMLSKITVKATENDGNNGHNDNKNGEEEEGEIIEGQIAA